MAFEKWLREYKKCIKTSINKHTLVLWNVLERQFEAKKGQKIFNLKRSYYKKSAGIRIKIVL